MNAGLLSARWMARLPVTVVLDWMAKVELHKATCCPSVIIRSWSPHTHTHTNTHTLTIHTVENVGKQAVIPNICTQTLVYSHTFLSALNFSSNRATFPIFQRRIKPFFGTCLWKQCLIFKPLWKHFPWAAVDWLRTSVCVFNLATFMQELATLRTPLLIQKRTNKKNPFLATDQYVNRELPIVLTMPSRDCSSPDSGWPVISRTESCDADCLSGS